MSFRLTRFLAFALLAASTAAPAQTLERIRDNGAFRIGYRVDAPPFSYLDSIGEASGYVVDICRHVAAQVKAALKLDTIKVEYVQVTAENRFDAVEQGRIDVLCGPTTVTLTRRERVDFSLYTFVDGASVLYRADGPDTFEGLAGKKVGVRAGTTTEQALKNTIRELGVEIEVVEVDSHNDGIARLESGALSAYFADRGILSGLLAASGKRSELRLSNRYFTHEAYALAMKRGDDDFRLLVDRTIARLYRSGEISGIFSNAFGTESLPTDILLSIYVVNSLAE